MPELSREELSKLYGPEGDYNTWRKQQAEDYLRSQKDPEPEEDNSLEEIRKKREQHLKQRGQEAIRRDSDRSKIDTKLSSIEGTKIDISAKVSDILGNSLKQDDTSFLDAINALIEQYPQYLTKIDPNANVININHPFRRVSFGNLPTTDSDYIKDTFKRKG